MVMNQRTRHGLVDAHLDVDRCMQVSSNLYFLSCVAGRLGHWLWNQSLPTKQTGSCQTIRAATTETARAACCWHLPVADRRAACR